MLQLIDFSDKGWNDRAANVVCNMLGFDIPYPEATWKTSFGNLSRTDYIISQVSCDGTEEILRQCINETNSDCCTGYAGVKCLGNETTSSEFNDSIILNTIICLEPDPNLNTGLQLVGGANKRQGEVLYNERPIW